MSKSKTLLITGGAGFIGSNLVEMAVESGYHVVVLDALTYAGHSENLDSIAVSESSGSFELVVGNICDRELVPRLLNEFSVDCVLNLAAESHVDRSIDSPSAFIETNIVGTFNLLNCALAYCQGLKGNQKKEFRFLQVSTDEVFGSLGDVGKFSEATPYQPNSPYSASKASADFLVRAWHLTYGLPTITTNCSNNYGPRQFPEKLIPHMILCALAGKPLPVYGDGKNIRDWIHVKDHCKGVLLALEKGRPGGTYCLGGNSEKNNIEVVTTICSVLDSVYPRVDGESYSHSIRFVADRPGHDRRYAIDDGLAEEELGFGRTYSGFSDGLEQTVRWYLEHLDWCEKVLKKSPKEIAFDWSVFK